MKEGDKLIVVDEKLDKLTKGFAEVLLPTCSTSKAQFLDSRAATTSISWPLSSTKKKVSSCSGHFG